MKTVFLDFDGVLFDTLKEAFVLCRYAYSNINIFEPINEDIYKLFYKYKFLVFNSWQYYYIMKLLSEHNYTNDNDFINQYNQFMQNRDTKKEEIFDKNYLSKRLDMMNNHKEFWNSLETPFPFFNKIKELYNDNKIDIIIVSKKNNIAINTRLNQYNLILEPSKVFAKEELLPYKTKAEFINEYMIKNNIATSFFVDDNSNNLRPCKNYPQITPLLANWGNIAINETGLSCKEIINILHK